MVDNKVKKEKKIVEIFNFLVIKNIWFEKFYDC